MAARKLLKKVLQSIVQDFCVVDVLGCLKGTRALTPCRAPRPTQDPKPLHLHPTQKKQNIVLNPKPLHLHSTQTKLEETSSAGVLKTSAPKRGKGQRWPAHSLRHGLGFRVEGLYRV